MGKEFKTNMAFLNTDDAEGQTEPKQEAPKKPRTKTAGKKKPKENLPPEKKRTRRVQTIFTPELYERLNNYAWDNRKSVNSTIVEAVEEYLRRHDK